MARANLYVLAKLLHPDQGMKEENRAATRRPVVTRPKAEAEPEARLWKVCAEAHGSRAYDVFRLEEGAWVWCGYGNGRAILPNYVRKRLTEGRPAECVVEGYRYCIKPPSRGQNRRETPRFFLKNKKRERLATPPR